MADTFANIQAAAHSGAFGAGSKASPTPAQIRAGNYAKGSTRLHGMQITIETPMFQPRRGKQDGVPWSVLCMAHYGYINGTKGADGDAVDIFVGPVPESLLVFVINQVNRDGAFDEHKVMLGFADEQSARDAYMNSYEKGWTGLGSLTACTIKQFKFWLKNGDMSTPLEPVDLWKKDEELSMTDVYVSWGAGQQPVGLTLGDALYQLRAQDPEGLLMDSVTMADLNEHLASTTGADGAMLDAMVVEYQQMERKANQFLKVMQMAADQVKPVSVEVSKPFKNRGTTQVAMLFVMDDGQTVSVFFHNPDSTPNKLTPTDELVSWKWVLNKKDITITVAPERGQDLNPREVSRRIMKFVQKNSAKFAQANANKAENDAKLDQLKADEASKTTELAALDKQIEELTAELAAKKAAPAPSEPAAAPAAAKRPYHEWEGDVLDELAALLEIGRSDADGIAMTQETLMQQLHADGKTPEEAAAAIKAATAVEPTTPEEEEMLAAHQKELAEAAAQAAADAELALEKEDTGEITPEGRENVVKTAKGNKVATGFKIIDASKLVISHEADGTVNPDYPAEIQPRDRARSTSQAWVQKTARSLDPDSLGRTQRADTGAPIVGPDRVVESGNGRAMAIREAYRLGQAGEYREWLEENAEYFGVDLAKIKRLKAPVLIRVRTSAIDRVAFAVEANQDDKLAMTATEKARSDARRLDTAMLAKLVEGDLSSAANRDFVAAFLQSLGEAESAQYLTTDGKPTSSLLSRLQAALFAGAYSDDRLLELTADVAKPEIANIVAALNSAAPDFMRAKSLDRVGAEIAGGQVTDSVELSLNQEAVNAIIAATNVLRQAKDSGMGLDEFLRQGDMFGGTDPAVAAMAVFIQANNRSAKRMGTAFKAMAQFVESENARKQTAGLFGDESASFTDIVAAANRKLEQEYGEGLFAIEQGDMFAPPPAAPAAEPSPEPAPEPDVDDQLKKAKAYLDSLIAGDADLGAPDLVLARLEEIYAQFGEGELKDLFEEASNAFRDYALKVTADAL
ncbi:hypothetical protein [Pseudomonas sp. PNPG3]|uniref:defense against restriction DarA-related protein n=1 Tax=Pseudomonas sp. PNPG3 TaxID=2919497 RepID=UPI001FFD7EBC|nr:hypothetical protein [Pseudomonas sp. PNPG3]MCK2122118.1 hypothetical protein [Pseudomonas sp. PNPG3]